MLHRNRLFGPAAAEIEIPLRSFDFDAALQAYRRLREDGRIRSRGAAEPAVSPADVGG
jgi:hypothetical protein